jgi:hypothetical protein
MSLKNRAVLSLALAIVLTAGLTAAGSTRFVSKWKNPVAGPINWSGEKVAAFVITAEESMRLGPEESLAGELRSRGIESVAGYTVLPKELARDKEKAKEFLGKAGITSVVLMRVLGREEKDKVYAPGTAWWSGPNYSGFWNYWGYSWTVVYTPGYLEKDKVYTIETLVYSVTQDQLVWAGRSETFNPKDIRSFIKDLVSAAGKEMRNAGLVQD